MNLPKELQQARLCTELATYETIVKYGLSIRQVPYQTVHTYEMRHFKAGYKVVKRHGRQMCQETRIPQNPGYWMCKEAPHTNAAVIWDAKTDNLAPTLHESVALYLEGRERPEG